MCSSDLQDFEPAFSDMVNAIRDAEGRISTYKTQIMALKGVQACPNCGAEVPISASFCNSCGTKMPEYIPAGMVKCPNCGQLVKEGTRFCTSCGNPFPQPEPAPEEAAPAEAAVDVPVAPVAEKVCPNCGAKVTEDMLFCVECGTKLK